MRWRSLLIGAAMALGGSIALTDVLLSLPRHWTHEVSGQCVGVERQAVRVIRPVLEVGFVVGAVTGTLIGHDQHDPVLLARIAECERRRGYRDIGEWDKFKILERFPTKEERVGWELRK